VAGAATGRWRDVFAVGIVIGSLAIGFTVERPSHGVGFVVAGRGRSPVSRPSW